jgi:allophycocyanin alpha subunit
MTATCLRDMDYYLRLITYGVVAGDVTPIEEIGLVGVREMYKSLGTDIGAVAQKRSRNERSCYWSYVF